MQVIGYHKIFLSISGILIGLSIVAILVFGLRLGIDFVGGTLWQIRFQNVDLEKKSIAIETLKNFFSTELNEKNVAIFPADNNSFLIRLRHLNESEHRLFSDKLQARFGDFQEIRFTGIGPAIGYEFQRKAFWAISLVLLGISLYVAFAFRKVSYPIKSWKYGIVTLITLFHDIIIPVGLLAILGKQYGAEIDTNSVVALLVIMGFSVHDTIVVFDRIRENISKERGQLDLAVIINKSVNQTFVRSINTSLTLIFVLLALVIWGPAALKYFILTILVGTVVGTYSSIFIASPLVFLWRPSTDLRK
jgi:preprotein translocase subunit SecF